MFECAWCKKKINDVQLWSKYHEPLCSECVPKYNFGKKNGMIPNKVSDLTKEQRREISVNFNRIERFVGGVRSVGKEILVGRMKLLSRVFGLAIFGAWIMVVLFIAPLIAPLFYGKDVLFALFCFGVIGVSVVLGMMLFSKIVWLLQFCQLKKRAELNGYWVGLDNPFSDE